MTHPLLDHFRARTLLCAGSSCTRQRTTFTTVDYYVSREDFDRLVVGKPPQDTCYADTNNGKRVESFEPLPEDPRFQALLRELELARLERARIEAEILRTVAGGRVAVCFGDSPAFGEARTWDKLAKLVTPWAVWARPAAQAMGVGMVWTKTAEKGQGVAQFEREMRRVWTHACETLMTPWILDLRGTPHSAGILAEAWREPLHQALKREGRGAVLIVAEGAGALARLL